MTSGMAVEFQEKIKKFQRNSDKIVYIVASLL